MDTELKKWVEIWQKNEVAYAGEVGYRQKEVIMPNKIDVKGGEKVLLNNPVTPDSIGDPQKKIYVTDNFSDGEKLRELDQAKKDLEKMQRDFHSAEVSGNQQEYKSLEKKLDTLKDKIEKLNNDIMPVPTKDLS